MSRADIVAGADSWSAEQIAAITGWLRDAGLRSIEITGPDGTRLFLSLGATERNAAAASLPAHPVGPQPVEITAPFFGRLLLGVPGRDEALAPVGHRLAAGDVVALLALDTLLLPVVATAGGTVREVLAAQDALVGFGTPILSLLPD